MGIEGPPSPNPGKDRIHPLQRVRRNGFGLLVVLGGVFVLASLGALVLQLSRSILNAETSLKNLNHDMSLLNARLQAFSDPSQLQTEFTSAQSASESRPNPPQPSDKENRAESGKFKEALVENSWEEPTMTPQETNMGNVRADATTGGVPSRGKLAKKQLQTCMDAQVEFFTRTATASNRKIKPFGWEWDTEMYRLLRTVTKRVADPESREDSREEGCAIFDVGMNKARKLTHIIHAVRRAQSPETAPTPTMDTLECEIHAYEPVPPTFAMAKERIQENFSEAVRKRIHLHNKGMGAELGSMLMGWNGNGDLGASLNTNRGYSNKRNVDVTTVDHEIEASAGGRRVAVLKIDVEGHEAPALKGAHRALESKIVDCLVWERHPMWKHALKLPAFSHEINKVAAYGYHVYYQEKDTVLRVDGEYWHDNLEPKIAKLDAIAVLVGSGLELFMQSNLLPDCHI